ncbi:hypothetical protein FS837_006926 [Tulasnella sp. UAMH 9824]|nr:hypothetical protein FS837_006926 [Tulasnella sp. UAMH 9824]
MSFGSLPDDILIELFTYLSFHSIIALRQTCRRCCIISKTKAIWLHFFRCVTSDPTGRGDTFHDTPSSRSSEDLENSITRMVRFETNWNNAHVQQIRYFMPPDGYVDTLVPGEHWQAWAMDLACIDPTAAHLQFDLALELTTHNPFSSEAATTRKITIWRVKVDENDELVAELTCSFDVFRTSAFGSPISLQGESLLRASRGPSGIPVYIVHRWKGLGDKTVSHSLLLTQARYVPEKGVRLLPDGRIISIFLDRLELHGPPDVPWEEGTSIGRNMVRAPPQWVFKYKTPINNLQFSVSRPMYYPKSNSVVFSIHNAESLFAFRIITDNESSPEVTTTLFRHLEDREYIGLDTSHAVRNKPGREEAVLMSFSQSPQLSELLSFAGIINKTSDAGLQSHIVVTEALLRVPHASSGGSWRVDEQSGPVLCSLGQRPVRPKCAVLYF